MFMLSSYRRAFRLVLTWQTGWDSNPRNACTSGGLVIRCLRPTQPPVRILQQEAPVLRNEPAVFVFLLMWLALSLMDDLASKKVNLEVPYIWLHLLGSNQGPTD